MNVRRALILASASPRRRELLATHGVAFSVEEAAVEEAVSAAEPRKLPEENARLKAEAVAARHPAALVIGADTVVLFRGRIIGKPRDLADAARILRELAGHEHEVVTGVALIGLAAGVRDSFSASTRIRFKPFGEETVRAYLARVPVLDKAGAYALQEHGELLVEAVEGDPDNAIGLPVGELLNRWSRYVR